MGFIAFIASEFASYVAGKAFDSAAKKVKKALSKKELERSFDAFCHDSRWQDVFENQGFAGGIDFSGLTEELKESIVDRTYEYYHSLDTRREDIQFEQYLKGLYDTAKADAAPQKKQVQEIVYAAYHMIAAFYIETLSPESRLAVNLSKRYTDERIAELAAQIKALAEKGTAAMALLDSYERPTPGFLGRQADLAEIERRFEAGEGIVVICGQGGLGKSELAKEYSRIHKGDYDMICFAYYKGSVAATVTDGLLWNHGDWNEGPTAKQFAPKSDYIKALGKRVLLILDDVTAMNDYADLLKISGRNTDILITTRVARLFDARPVMLGSLGDEDCLRLFQHNAGIPEDAWDGWYHEHEAAVREIIQDILLRHTMLVMLAAGLLAVTDKSAEDIRDSLKNNRLSPEIGEPLYSFKDAGREDGGPVETTLYEHVRKLYSIACFEKDEGKIAVLRNMSLIPYSGVALSAFRRWMGLDNLDDVNALAGSGWLTPSFAAGGNRVAMHAVISDAVYVQTEPTAENCAVLLDAIADDMAVGAMKNPADKTYMIEYGEFALNRIKQEDKTIARIAHQTGYLLNFRAEYGRALEWYFRANVINEKMLGKKHPDTATTYNNIAGVYDRQGEYPKALEWYTKALVIREKVLGEEHSHTASSYNNIAGVYQSQGEYPKALEWYTKALAIVEKVLGKEHPDTAATYNNIAVVYKSQGEYLKALEWYTKDLAIVEKVLGREHPDTATTYNNIAGVYKSQGEYPKALEWYMKDLAVSEKVLGKEHPDTAVTYNNIAGVYKSQGEYPKALEWYAKALPVQEKVLGKEHPSTATTYNNIAGVYYSQGEYPKALEWYMKDLAASEKVLGREHPDTAVTYNNIGVLYANQGEFPEALVWMGKALTVREKKLGMQHPYTVGTREDIAEVKRRMGGE